MEIGDRGGVGAGPAHTTPPMKLVTRMDAGQFLISWPQVRTDDQRDSGAVFGGKYDTHKAAKSGPEEQEQEAFLRSGKGSGC